MCVRQIVPLALVLWLGVTVPPASARNPLPVNNPVVVAPLSLPVPPVGSAVYSQPAPHYPGAAVPTYQPGETGTVFADEPPVPSRAWFEGEYLLWSVKGFPTPPLVASNPLGTPRESIGLLATVGTEIVVGGEHLNDDYTSGFRVRGGLWFSDSREEGFDIGFFGLLPIESNYQVGPSLPILSRPFLSAETNAPAARLVAYPDVATGEMYVRARTEVLGGEAHLRFNLLSGEPNLGCGACGDAAGATRRLDFLFGYRYFRLTDRLRIEDQQRFLADDFEAADTRIVTRDHFWVTNDINAADFVFNYRWQRDRLSLAARLGIGLGWLRTTTQIDGQTLVLRPEATALEVLNGGFLAQATNSGEHHAQRFTVLPEFNLTLGYQLTDRVRVNAGWTALYISRVMRGGDQVDITLNASQFQAGTLTGEARPVFSRNYTDLFLQGFNFGLEWQF